MNHTARTPYSLRIPFLNLLTSTPDHHAFPLHLSNWVATSHFFLFDPQFLGNNEPHVSRTSLSGRRGAQDSHANQSQLCAVLGVLVAGGLVSLATLAVVVDTTGDPIFTL
jgi:hypothetical protein